VDLLHHLGASGRVPARDDYRRALLREQDANKMAVPRPIPCVEPVMTATSSFSRSPMCLPSCDKAF
jgi:hypothetical protein